MVHGNPAWGYLYRDFMPPLVQAGYRVIVPDLLGAGRSNKPGRPQVYTVRRHAERTSRIGVLVVLREIPTGPGDPVSRFWGELEDGLERHVRNKPAGIAWGMKDAASTPAVLEELWLGTFPYATVTRVPDAGHFVQEDAYERVVPALLGHLRGSSRPAGVSANGQTK